MLWTNTVGGVLLRVSSSCFLPFGHAFAAPSLSQRLFPIASIACRSWLGNRASIALPHTHLQLLSSVLRACAINSSVFNCGLYHTHTHTNGLQINHFDNQSASNLQIRFSSISITVVNKASSKMKSCYLLSQPELFYR